MVAILAPPPFAALSRILERGTEPLQEYAPGDFLGAEADHVFGPHLRVEKIEFPFTQLGHPRCECDFRCVRSIVKHGFAKERFSERDAVNTAGELPVEPCFD